MPAAEGGRAPAGEVLPGLSGSGIDRDEQVVLTTEHVVTLLRDFLAGRTTADELNAWAEAVECRDDVGREAGREAVINDALFALSTPELLDRPLRDVAHDLVVTLAGQTDG